MKRTSIFLVPTITIAILASVLGSSLLVNSEPVHRTIDKSRMKMLALSAQLYAFEHNNRMPPAKAWSNALLRYSKDPEPTQCSCLPTTMQQGAHGHVLEESVPGTDLETYEEPQLTPMFFDGAKLEQDAVDSMTGIRLTDYKGRLSFTIAFSDGHVRHKLVEVVDR